MPAAKMNSVLASIPIWRAWAFCLQSWACGAAGSALPWHGRGRRFDPHRPYQPNRLKKHVLAQVHCPVYLSCILPFSRNTMQSPQGAIASAGITSGPLFIHRPSHCRFSVPILPRRYASISVLPACLAQSAGVAPQRMSCKSSLAPRSTRSWTTSSWPPPAAWCSGVVWEWPPIGLYRFGSSPASSNNRTIST